MTHHQKTKLILLTIIFFTCPLFVSADQLGQENVFFVDSSFDSSARTSASSTLIKITSSIYFYFDNGWWNDLEQQKQEEAKSYLLDLGEEFETKIYPVLTRTFGSEWNPGIDRDTRITVLFHQMKQGAAGYFSSADEYPRAQAANSNEREMVYLNSDYLASPLIKSFLAHEFVHLITFNQKDKNSGVSEEVWLNEARAEYAPTLLGYDKDYENSNLKARVRDFREMPQDSLIEWKNQKTDYGVISLFVQYLVDQYGEKILVDSLQSSKTGIESLNYALEKNKFKEDFAQIFTDWTIAVYLNDCSVSLKYCFTSQNLKNFRITPQINFLPLSGKSSLTVVHTTKNWSGNWYKFIGGNNVLRVEFSAEPETGFKIPYIVQNKENGISLEFLEIDSEGKGVIYVPDFNNENISLTLIPSIQKKLVSSDGPFYSFSWSASTVEKTPEEEKKEEEELIQKLLKKIEELKAEIARIQAKIDEKMGSTLFSCQKIENNLYYGLTDNQEVRCLQELLKAQDSGIYPEGIVSGYFGPLTQSAVIRFQEKHALEILALLGLQKGTGFVGPATRAKLNEFIKTQL